MTLFSIIEWSSPGDSYDIQEKVCTDLILLLACLFFWCLSLNYLPVRHICCIYKIRDDLWHVETILLQNYLR